MEYANELHERIARIKSRLERAALERWGSVPQIVAVSKNVDAQRVNALVKEGLVRLGENRVQELLQKKPHLDAAFRIDLIGRLQSNKVKYVIDQVSMIQSLDRESLAQEIDRRAQQRGLQMPVLLQVNIGREAQKGGVDPDDVFSFAQYTSALPGLKVKGLMAVMPDIQDEDELRPFFIKMRRLFEALKQEAINGTQIEELSMGMSGDYELAAQEGATIVRIGSAIFGARNHQTELELSRGK